MALDPLGAVSVKVASVPQGQGHRTVLAQVVAETLGVEMEAVRVLADVDTARDAWSIASGNYSSRFAPAVAGTAKLAAERIRARLRASPPRSSTSPRIRSSLPAVACATGVIRTTGSSFARVAAASHWAPATVPDDTEQTIRETVFWTPDELEAADAEKTGSIPRCATASSSTSAVIEIDRETGEARIDRYVTMHDCGRILHPGMVDGQVRGGFAHAVGAALYEEYAYGADGSFLTGTLADYLIPTVKEVPDPLILHHETPSPLTPLGAKGVGEGNCMSTPVCIANAVADALGRCRRHPSADAG